MRGLDELTMEEAIERLGPRLWKYVWDRCCGTRHCVTVEACGYEHYAWGNSLRECVEKAEAWIEEKEREVAEAIAAVQGGAGGA